MVATALSERTRVVKAYNAAWMRDYRARKKAERLALEQTADSRPLRTPPDVPGDRDL